MHDSTTGAGRRRRAAVAAAAGALLAGTVLVPPAQAAATATTCGMREGLDLRDSVGNVFHRALYCDNLPSDVYARATFDARITGWLVLSPSWFPCYTNGPKDTQGNTVWYYTQGDRVGEMPRIKAWGAVPAEVVQVPVGASHPYPADLPRCPWY